MPRVVPMGHGARLVRSTDSAVQMSDPFLTDHVANRETPSPAPGVAFMDSLRAVSTHAFDAVVIMDHQGVIGGWNHAAEQLFGWPAADVIGQPLDRIVIPERYRAAHRAGLQRYLRTGTGKVLDMPIDIDALHRDGHEINVELSIMALSDGKRTTFVGFIRDLSQQRRLAAALWDNEAKLTSIIENLPGVAYIDEVGGAGLYVSPTIESILGYTAEEWLADDHLWERLLHPDDRQRAVAEIRHGEVSGGSFSSLYRITARNGREVWIRDRAVVQRGSDGRVRIHGVMFDITRERDAELQLELAIAEQVTTAESLQRLPTGQPMEVTAQLICEELSRIANLDVAVVYAFGRGGAVTPIGQFAPGGAPTAVGHSLPQELARYLRDSATGPWIDDLGAERSGEGHGAEWRDAGLTCIAYVPIGGEGGPLGLVSAGTTGDIGTTGIARWMPSLAQFGAIAAALLGPELASRAVQDGAREEIERIVRERDLTTVYQPIVRLRDSSVIGFEALTRFADGVPPDQRFAQAEEAGMGLELETTALSLALESAEALPSSAFLSVNLSHLRLSDDAIRRSLRPNRRRRRMVVEITERTAIEDYGAVRANLAQLPPAVEVAVDDAGAGFASLRHILELTPQYVKLDLQLVRGVDADPVRQALVAGMVHFSRQAGCMLIAEGIESEAELAALRLLGVPCGQGFLFGMPAPARAFGTKRGLRALSETTPRSADDRARRAASA